MQFDVWTKGLVTLEAECLVLGIFDEGELTEEARGVDAATGGRLGKLICARGFPGPQRRNAAARRPRRASRPRACCSTGLGSQEELQPQEFSQGALPPPSPPWPHAHRERGVCRRPPLVQGPGRLLLRPRRSRKSSATPCTGSTTSRPPRNPSRRRSTRCWPGPCAAAAPPPRKRGLTHGAAIAAAAKVQRDLGEPARQRLHPDLPRGPGARAREVPLFREGHRAGRSRHPQGEDGLLPRGHAGQRRAAPLHRHRIQGAESAEGAHRARRQGHHVRHRRHLAQRPADDGRDEVRHERLGRGHRGAHAGGRRCACR